MMRRAGFTLLEVMVALVLTGVVALLVYGSARAGTDTAHRLAANRDALQSARAMRVLIEDAVRSARALPRPSDTAFVLEHRTAAGGAPADRLALVVAGGVPPLAPDADWRVSIQPTPQGLEFVARPSGSPQSTPVVALLPGVTGLRVLVRSDTGWTDRWPAPQAVPRAVRLTYWSDSGVVGLPLLVTLPFGGN